MELAGLALWADFKAQRANCLARPGLSIGAHFRVTGQSLQIILHRGRSEGGALGRGGEGVRGAAFLTSLLISLFMEVLTAAFSSEGWFRQFLLVSTT